jgi:anti-anti-sigma factor
MPAPSPRIRSAHSTQQLRCEIVPERDVVAVLVLGELDIATVPTVDATLRDLREAGFASLRLDLRRLEFIDGAGIALLRRWRHLAELEAFALAIQVADGPVRRALQLTSAERLLALDV